MKILIFSDTHGDYIRMSDCIKKHPDAEILVHCGDGEDQSRRMVMNFPDKMVIRVRGNCDLGSALPAEEYFTVFGKKIMVTHGHYYDVKYGLRKIHSAAKEQGIDIVFFGHTHEAHNEYKDGVYIFNPGNCSGWRPSYGIVEITENGDVLLNTARA